MKTNKCQVTRTTMTSLVTFLDFTGEDKTMFSSGRLPTIVTGIWENEDGLMKHKMKPKVGVQGIVKYMENIRLSQLAHTDKSYKPMYKGSEFNEGKRQEEKYMRKMSWFKGKLKVKVDGETC